MHPTFETLVCIKLLKFFKFFKPHKIPFKPLNPPNLLEPLDVNLGGIVHVQFLELGEIFYTKRKSFSRVFQWYIIHPIRLKCSKNHQSK